MTRLSPSLGAGVRTGAELAGTGAQAPSENRKAEPGDPPARLPPPAGGNKHFLRDILFFFF